MKRKSMILFTLFSIILVGCTPQPSSSIDSGSGESSDSQSIPKSDSQSVPISGSESSESSSSENVEKALVEFDVNGGTPTISAQVIIIGEFVEEPIQPTKENYNFNYWQVEGTNREWNFNSDRVEGDLVLVAQWTKNQSSVDIKYTAHYLGDVVDALYTNNEISASDSKRSPSLQPKQSPFITKQNSVNYPEVKPIEPSVNLPTFLMPWNPDGFVWEEIGNGLYLTFGDEQLLDEEGDYRRKGISNVFGEWVLEPEKYVEIDHFYNDIAIAEKFIAPGQREENERYGYLIHTFENGRDVVKDLYLENNARFYSAGSFQGEYAIVTIKDDTAEKYGVINKEGEYVLEPQFDYIHQEIVDNKVIVANNARSQESYYPLEYGYYSDEIGVYDLASATVVIAMDNSIVTCLADNRYFAYKKQTNVSVIINTSDNTVSDVEGSYFNLVTYDEDYYIGLSGEYLYLVEKTSFGVAAVYERYARLLEYFGIQQGQHYTNIIYNFNTFTNISRKVDFIRSNLYFYGGNRTDIGKKVGNNIIDAVGNVVYEIEENNRVFYNEYGVEIETFNNDILFPDGLVFIEDLTNNSTYKAINYQGEVVGSGFSQVTTFQNGKALVTKKHSVDGYEIELMYTLYNDGKLVPVDIGLDYFKQNIDYLAEPSNKSIIIREYLQGVYHVRVMINQIKENLTYSEDYIINVYGDIIFDQEIHTIGRFQKNEVDEYSDFVKKYFKEEDLDDMLYITKNGNEKTVFKLIRNDINDDISEERAAQLVMQDKKVFLYHYKEYTGTSPYMFNFDDGNSIDLYLDGELVNDTNYVYHPNVQHLDFSKAYVDSLEKSKTEFRVVAGEQEVIVTLYKEGVALSINEYLRAVGNYSAGRDVLIGTNNYINLHLESLGYVDSLSIARLNGVDVREFVDLKMGHERYDVLAFDHDFAAGLALGYYVLEYGNEDKIATIMILIVGEENQQHVTLYDGATIIGYHFSNQFNKITYLPTFHKEGMEFVGWFLDEECTEGAATPFMATGETSLYGKWI